MQLVLQFFLLSFIFQTSCFSVSNAVECKTNSPNSSQVARTIRVSQSGDGNFTTITDALNSIPFNNDRWIKISLDPGTYKEQIIIGEDKPCIVLEGRDRTSTIITFDAHNTTSGSTTFTADAENFVATGVTFRNSYNLPPGQSKNEVIQAVAFRNRGDKQAFYECGFEGYQDTLRDDEGRHYYHSCYIEGAVDFIWGDGQSLFKQCAINVTGAGFITAQGRENANDLSGYVFRQCNVSGTGPTYLGRAYRAFARVIFIDSFLDNVVDPSGWVLWHGQEDDVVFAEVNCTGPGADTSKRVPWMTKNLPSSTLEQYTTSDFIDNERWIAKLPVAIPR